MRPNIFLLAAAAALVTAGAASAAELWIGAAQADITPDRPVALDGQFNLRVARKADTPITANVLVLESREGGRLIDSVVMVSCDLVTISDIMFDNVRRAAQKRLPDFDSQKMFLNATHTHTAPVTRPGVYDIPQEGVMQPEAYCGFAAARIAEAIGRAWEGRTPGSFTWGLGHAAVAENRRAVYADGSAVMYGKTNRPDFRGLEGYEDHGIGTLFFWDKTGKLIAMAVNVSCPSQEVEGLSSLNADFWHPVREMIHKRYGPDVCVLGWTGAAGDQSPHLMYCQNAEERMRQLRKLTRLEELARRVAGAVDETFEAVKNDRHADVPFSHKVETLQLPMRLVSDTEYAEVKAAIAREKPSQMRERWHKKILARYEKQKTEPNPLCRTTIHVLRIGDVAICTNPFELFVDYGVQMKARSPAVQTFVIQLANCGEGLFGYLATERAVGRGGYGAIIQSNQVGPEGGQLLVEQTLGAINRLFGKLEPGVSAYTFRKVTAFEAIEKAKACGAGVIELFLWQKLSPEHPDVILNQNLSDGQLAALKAKLQTCGVKAVNAYFSDIGKTEAETRKLFEFAKKLGLRGLTGEPPVDRLDLVEKLVKETGVQLCFHNHAKNPAKPEYRNWDPDYLMGLMKGRDPRMGFSVDTGHITRSGMDAVAYLKTVKGRVLSVHLKDIQEAKPGSPDLPYGQGIGNIPAVLDELKRQGFDGPVGVEFDHLSEHPEADVMHCLDVIRKHG